MRKEKTTGFENADSEINSAKMPTELTGSGGANDTPENSCSPAMEENSASGPSEMSELSNNRVGVFTRFLLSQPNSNHNPNNKTTINVVGLRLSNHWVPPTQIQNTEKWLNMAVV